MVSGSQRGPETLGIPGYSAPDHTGKTPPQPLVMSRSGVRFSSRAPKLQGSRASEEQLVWAGPDRFDSRPVRPVGRCAPMATPTSFEDFHRLAGDLFRRFPPASPGASFSHVGTDVAPGEVLRRLRSSPAASVLLADGQLANRPERTDHREVLPIHASEGALRTAAVRVSFWAPPAWDFRAASLDVRLVFGAEPWAARGGEPLVVRVHGAAAHPSRLRRPARRDGLRR